MLENESYWRDILQVDAVKPGSRLEQILNEEVIELPELRGRLGDSHIGILPKVFLYGGGTIELGETENGEIKAYISVRLYPYEGMKWKITKEVIKRHGMKIFHHTYTPKDMNEPLEDFYFFLFIASGEDFKEVSKETKIPKGAKKILREIREKIDEYDEKIIEGLF